MVVLNGAHHKLGILRAYFHRHVVAFAVPWTANGFKRMGGMGGTLH
jgi:hypothetical protein